MPRTTSANESIGDGVDVVATPPLGQRGVGAHRVPILVVHLTRGGVPENPERLGDLLEELAGPLVPEIDVGEYCRARRWYARRTSRGGAVAAIPRTA